MNPLQVPQVPPSDEPLDILLERRERALKKKRAKKRLPKTLRKMRNACR